MNVLPDKRDRIYGPERNGVITRYVPNRQFGFIVSRIPEGFPKAGEMQSFFFHVINIRYCQPELPDVGCPVVFNENLRPAKPGKFPLVDNLRIYNRPEPDSTSNALAGVSALAGGPVVSDEPTAQPGDTVGAQ